MYIVRIDSVVDVITNSSTVIYTYQDGAVQPLKEMIEEFGKVMGFNESADDMFWVGVFSDVDRYIESDDLPSDLSSLGWEKKEVKVQELIRKILRGEEGRPQWMKDVDDKKNCLYLADNSNIVLLERSSKYKDLGDAILKFLNSVESDGGRDG